MRVLIYGQLISILLLQLAVFADRGQLGEIPDGLFASVIFGGILFLSILTSIICPLILCCTVAKRFHQDESFVDRLILLIALCSAHTIVMLQAFQ